MFIHVYIPKDIVAKYNNIFMEFFICITKFSSTKQAPTVTWSSSKQGIDEQVLIGKIIKNYYLNSIQIVANMVR